MRDRKKCDTNEDKTPREEGDCDMRKVSKHATCPMRKPRTCADGGRSAGGEDVPARMHIASAVGFINKIKKVLECVCFNCGKILLDEVSVASLLEWRGFCFLLHFVCFRLTCSNLRAIRNFRMPCDVGIQKSVLIKYGSFANRRWFAITIVNPKTSQPTQM